ncbi:polar amino acid transport system substrate-binding protein [Alkalibacterium putridalgicola]|uniref:Amino acid ABC transporter permease n=2 Tax=Alkalibacterium putridalgicola TaxID=426703 RepID=A0A1H7WN23_9LACT|nr:amino acid ABC transporter permease [Alkalibacterium putridalgicola]SEM22337.1 polar amino acid transport system substrate-binding protein [Alkalibacterium putridalgicola]
MKVKKKSHILIGLMFLLTLASSLLVPEKPAEAAEQSDPYIIATDVTFAPFEYQNEDGEYIGIDIELLAAIAEDQGFEYELRPMNFSAGLQALEGNQVDGMIAAMSITPERENSFDFSEPYIDAGPVLAVHEDNDEITSYDDLDGKTLAVKIGTTGAQFADELAEDYDITINQFEDSANMYEDVAAGQADAAVEDYPVMAYAIQQGLPLKLPTESEEGYPVGFAVNEDQNQELLEMFNAGLTNIKENGTYDEIMDTYLISSENTEEEGAEETAAQMDPYIIATDVTFAPFEYQNDDNEYIGIDIDLLAAIAEDQGFTYELRPMNFSAGLQALETNQVDGMIAAMSITPEREESFDFSEPYIDAGPVLAVHEDNDEITSYEDLDGKTLAVKVGTTGAQFADELAEEYDITINQFEDSANMYEDVAAGQADAAVEDYPVMAYAIQQGLPLKLPTQPEEGYPIGFAVNEGQNQELLEMFNAGLVNVMEDSTYDEIMDTYLISPEDAEVAEDTGIFSLLSSNFDALMAGLGRTLLLTLVSFAISLVAGTIFGLFSATKNRALNLIANIYVTVLRGIPLIVLAFFMYFSVPQLFDIQLTAFMAGIITLSLNTTAYISEQVRGGIAAVPIGQLEAARSLGLPYRQSMQKVVLPQAIKIMIPSLINQLVITLKDTSILSVIGIVELTQSGRIIIARSYQSGAMWIIVGLIYLIIITLLTKLSNLIERSLMND